MEGWRLAMEMWKVFRPVVSDAHHLMRNWFRGSGDPHQKEKSDPDHIKENNRIRIRIKERVG
jgi:hypothetical protein